jgi:hypothetical protein
MQLLEHFTEDGSFDALQVYLTHRYQVVSDIVTTLYREQRQQQQQQSQQHHEPSKEFIPTEASSPASETKVYIAVVKARVPQTRKPLKGTTAPIPIERRYSDATANVDGATPTPTATVFSKPPLSPTKTQPSATALLPQSPPVSHTTSSHTSLSSQQPTTSTDSSIENITVSSTQSNNQQQQQQQPQEEPEHQQEQEEHQQQPQQAEQVGGFAIVLFHTDSGHLTVLDLLLRVPGIRRGDMESDILREVLIKIQKDHSNAEPVVVGAQDTGDQDGRDDVHGDERGLSRMNIPMTRNGGNRRGQGNQMTVLSRLEGGDLVMVMEKSLTKWQTHMSKIGFYKEVGNQSLSLSDEVGDGGGGAGRSFMHEEVVKTLMKSRKDGVKLTMKVQSLMASIKWSR